MSLLPLARSRGDTKISWDVTRGRSGAPLTFEAIAEARRRWGAVGAISVAGDYRRSRLLVGELRGGRFWIRGRGSSWEAAFADADARILRASRRMAAH